MSELSMVYYNNLLSLPPLLILIYSSRELPRVMTVTSNFWEPRFQVFATLGGLLGFAISFTSMWFISNSTATFYGLTGSLNKVIVVIVGMIMFNEPTNTQNLSSIALGLAAGALLGFAKLRSR